MINLSPNKLFGDALDPLSLLWVVLLLLAWGGWRRRERKTSVALFVLWVSIWLVAATPFSSLLLATLERPYLPMDRDALAEADAVICLGGGLYPQSSERLGFSANDACDRYLAAFDLMRTLQVEHLVIGGSDYRTGNQHSSEGLLLKAWAERWKLDFGRVHLLEGSLSTRDEALRVRALMEEQAWEKVLLVTSAWHMRRSLAVFAHHGVQAQPVGCDFRGLTGASRKYGWKIFPQSGALETIHFYLHERVGFVYYQLRGWI